LNTDLFKDFFLFVFFLNIVPKTSLFLVSGSSFLQQTSIMERKYDLDERPINFAGSVIDISETLPNTIAGRHLTGQLVRSGTAPALHYGEAQGPNPEKTSFIK